MPPYPKQGKKPKKKRNAIPKKIVEAVFKRDSNLCQYCGCYTAGFDPDSILISSHCHHIKHRSQGGLDVADNLNTCCGFCHEKHGEISAIDRKWFDGKDVYLGGRMFK